MYEIVYTRKFLRDFKKHTKSGLNFRDRLDKVIVLLGSKSLLGKVYKDHKLNGKWDGYRGCHILLDLLLVYKYHDRWVELVTLDTHEALF